LVDKLEGFVLDREELLDALVVEHFEHSLVLDEVCEVALVGFSGFLDFDGLRVDVPEFSFFLVVDLGDSLAGFAFGHACC
jgi:hypothetical protein